MVNKVYISGRITGMEVSAPILFQSAEDYLISKGFEPVNPMKLNHDHDKTWQSYMKHDIKALCDCDIIYMLNNWGESKGAIIEHEIASSLGMGIIYQKK